MVIVVLAVRNRPKEAIESAPAPDATHRVLLALTAAVEDRRRRTRSSVPPRPAAAGRPRSSPWHRPGPTSSTVGRATYASRGPRLIASLAKKEFTLLRVLATDPTRVFGKDELLRDVWGFRLPAGRTRTLDSHASRLRRKLDPEGSRYVVNCWGIGYSLLPLDREAVGR